MKDVRFVKGADHKNSDATTMTCRRMNIWNIQGQYCSFRLAYTGVLVWPDDIASGFVSLWEDCAKRHSTVRDREEQHSTYLSVIGRASGSTTPPNVLGGCRDSVNVYCMNTTFTCDGLRSTNLLPFAKQRVSGRAVLVSKRT